LTELALAVDRAADQRAAFIKQRWALGRAPGGAGGGGQGLRLPAPLAAKDTLELVDVQREALALVEAASWGIGAGAGGPPGAAAVGARRLQQDRALKWAQGALAKAIEDREARLRWV
jgi:hypothetical protein